MYDDFYNHLVPEEAHSVLASLQSSNEFDYIQWYFRVSHPYMTPDAHGDPPWPTYQELSEEEQARKIMSLMFYLHFIV